MGRRRDDAQQVRLAKDPHLRSWEVDASTLTFLQADAQHYQLLDRTMPGYVDIEWLRPAIQKTPNPQEDVITFQHTDIDQYVAPKRAGFIGPSNGVVPVVRLYGVTEDEESVLCHVHGFHPYFYVYTAQKPDQSKLLQFRRMLDKKAKGKYAQLPWVRFIEEMVLEVDYVSSRSIYGYFSNDQQHFLKIVLAIPYAMQPVKDLFAEGGGLDSMGVYFEGRLSGEGHRIFEANIDYETRFMCDLNIHACAWITLHPKKYKMRPDQERTSHCQLECDVNYTDLFAHPPEGRWANIAPLRTLSFDIETTVYENLNPRPTHESVIQISNIVTKHGHDKPFITCIFTLRSCAPIEGVVIKSYNNEAEMLMEWYKFVIDVDPDIFTGWCIQIFDIRFLIERAQFLGITNFLYLGRLTKAPGMQLRKHQLNAHTSNTAYIYNTEGRVQLDLALAMQRYRPSGPTTQKLNEAAAKYIGDKKGDMEFSNITRLFNGSAQDRRELALYCIKDSKLVQGIIDKLKFFDYLVELSRLTRAPLKCLLNPGQQTKLKSLLLREAKKRNYLLPDVQADPPLAPQTKDTEIPQFATLYPNVIINNSLCYTTLLSKSTITRYKLQPDEYLETPVGTYFKKPDKSHQPVLPSILENLLANRVVVLNDLIETPEKKLLEARKDALETSVGLLMSFVNYYESGLPCYEIAISLKPIAHQSPVVKRTRSETRGLEDRAERSIKLMKSL